MSSEDNRREQAQKLLRSFTDIDDRFLMEAMKGSLDQEETSEDQGQDTGQQRNDPNRSEVWTGSSQDQGSQDQSPQASGENGKSGRLRRYSRWALTVAACLTVVVVGRYVSVNTVKNNNEVPVAETQLAKDDAQPDAAQDNSAQEDSSQDVAAQKDAAQDGAARDGAAQKDAAQDGAAREDTVDSSMKEDSAQENAEGRDAEMSAAAEGVDQDMDSAQEAAEGQVMEAAQEAPAEEGAEMSVPAGAAGAGNSSLMMANPFIDVKTLEEAEEAAGFTLELPETVQPYDTVLYRAMQGKMIEVIFLNKEDEEGYRIRKGKDMGDDISGDYTEYPAEETLETEEGVQVLVKGEKEDQWSVAEWNQEAENGTVYSYAVCAGARTFSSEEIKKFVSKMSAT